MADITYRTKVLSDYASTKFGIVCSPRELVRVSTVFKLMKRKGEWDILKRKGVLSTGWGGGLNLGSWISQLCNSLALCTYSKSLWPKFSKMSIDFGCFDFFGHPTLH